MPSFRFLGSRNQRIAEGAGGKGATSKNVKNRQKVSKSFSTLFDNFRAGQKKAKTVKKRQRVFRHFSTIFARHLFSGLFWGAPKEHQNLNHSFLQLGYHCRGGLFRGNFGTAEHFWNPPSCEPPILSFWTEDGLEVLRFGSGRPGSCAHKSQWTVTAAREKRPRRKKVTLSHADLGSEPHLGARNLPSICFYLEALGRDSTASRHRFGVCFLHLPCATILTQMMADEFNFLWLEIQNYIAEADADLIPVPGQLELRGRCR